MLHRFHQRCPAMVILPVDVNDLHREQLDDDVQVALASGTHQWSLTPTLDREVSSSSPSTLA